MTAATAAPASAQQRAAYRFQDQTIAFSHIAAQKGEDAIGINDPALRGLLNDLGATVTWQQGQRYVLITTARPSVISFAIGDAQYDVGPVQERAPFAPFVRNGEAYVPFDELMQGLGLLPKRDGGETVLQPQLTSLDVQTRKSGAVLVAHAGIPLDAHVLHDGDGAIVIAFDGVGTTLAANRSVGAGGVRDVALATEGSVTNPRTVLTISLMPGTPHGTPSTDDQRDFVIGFGSAAVAVQPSPPPQQPPTPASSSAPDQSAWTGGATTAPQPAVTSVNGANTPGGYQISVAVNGNASYEWHRLRPPDNRWYIDIHDAKLAIAPTDLGGGASVQAVRVRQAAGNAVRIALSLRDYQAVTVQPTDAGLTIDVSNALADVQSTPKSGSGSVGSAAVANTNPAGEPVDNTWKFNARPVSGIANSGAKNPRLIVIDPGHGGDDPGSMHGSLREADLTLDMAKRLRTVLIARGWLVIMTRTTDHDVDATARSTREAASIGHDNADAYDLQARDDIANEAGARLFVSIHANAYMNAGPHGTTTYYSKPIDVSLARDMERRLAAGLGTTDDGIVKSKLYVTMHADMPAVLVETAFLSNPDDYAKLSSPDWRQQVARSIADAIGDYAGAAPPGSQDSGQ